MKKFGSRRFCHVVTVVLSLLIVGLSAEAQISERPREGYEYFDMKHEMDLPSINEWINQSSTVDTDTAAQSWSQLILTMPANRQLLSRCEHQFMYKKMRLFDLNLNDEAQKALARYVRIQMQEIEKSFSFWIPFGSVAERRHAAVASAFECLERMDLSGTAPEHELRSMCLRSFKWSQPLQTSESSFRALRLFFSLYKTMLVLSCSEMSPVGFPSDAATKHDLNEIYRIYQSYFVGQWVGFDTRQRLIKWLIYTP